MALILSHAHLDHHGLAHHIHPDVPVYGSRGTLEMLRVSNLFIPDAAAPTNILELPIRGSLNIGPFKILGIPVDHAAPDSRALLIESDRQRLLYSGDLRAHGRQPHLFDSLTDAAGQIDVLILEGTTVGQAPESHGLSDEADVERKLCELFRQDRGLVVVIASGQNIDRSISVYLAAQASNRELVLDAYQAYVLMTLKHICPEAPQFDWPGVRVKFTRKHVAKLKDAGLWNLACKMSRVGKVSANQLADNPRDFAYLARSSGATAALLRYLAKTTRPTVIWSQWAGYLEKGGAVPRFCDEYGLPRCSSIQGDMPIPRISRSWSAVCVRRRWSQSTLRRPQDFPNSCRTCAWLAMGKPLELPTLCGKHGKKRLLIQDNR